MFLQVLIILEVSVTAPRELRVCSIIPASSSSEKGKRSQVLSLDASSAWSNRIA